MLYKISVSGQGGIFGLGKITKDQWEFWAKNSDHLPEVISHPEEEPEIKVPEKSKLKSQFYEICDEWTISGIFEDDLHIVVEDENLDRLVECSLDEFISENDPDDKFDLKNFSKSQYYIPTEKSKTYYLFWQNLQNATFWEQDIELEVFDPRKLKFIVAPIEDHGDVVIEVLYEKNELVSMEYELSPYVTASVHKI